MVTQGVTGRGLSLFLVFRPLSMRYMLISCFLSDSYPTLLNAPRSEGPCAWFFCGTADVHVQSPREQPVPALAPRALLHKVRVLLLKGLDGGRCPSVRCRPLPQQYLLYFRPCFRVLLPYTLFRKRDPKGRYEKVLRCLLILLDHKLADLSTSQ